LIHTAIRELAQPNVLPLDAGGGDTDSSQTFARLLDRSFILDGSF
jgi:hypothetical protein